MSDLYPNLSDNLVAKLTSGNVPVSVIAGLNNSAGQSPYLQGLLKDAGDKSVSFQLGDAGGGTFNSSNGGSRVRTHKKCCGNSVILIQGFRKEPLNGRSSVLDDRGTVRAA